MIWVLLNWSPLFFAIATQICLVLAQDVGEIEVKRGKTSHRYEVFTINYALQQHIPQLKTEQSAQGQEMLENKVQWLLLNQRRNAWQMRGALSLPSLSRSHPCRADLRHTTPQKMYWIAFICCQKCDLRIQLPATSPYNYKNFIFSQNITRADLVTHGQIGSM